MNRHQHFQDLHQSGCFGMPNPWDIGSAKLMTFKRAVALATTPVGRDEALRHAAEIVAAIKLPVNGELENDYGEAREVVAKTIYLAGEVGLLGATTLYQRRRN